MANPKYLTDLKNTFQGIVDDIEGIKYFIFDDLSKVNADSKKDFPLLLVKPPSSESDTDILEYSFMDVDMFMFAPELSDDTMDWTEQYDECHALMLLTLRTLFAMQPTYQLVGKVKHDVGHMQHNDKLIGSRARFKLRIYNGC